MLSNLSSTFNQCRMNNMQDCRCGEIAASESPAIRCSVPGAPCGIL
jgi:hypothetical protein